MQASKKGGVGGRERETEEWWALKWPRNGKQINSKAISFQNEKKTAVGGQVFYN